MTTTATHQPEPPAPSPAAPPGKMPKFLFALALIYLVLLLALFITYVSSSAFRHDAPTSFGQIPVGVVWFGAIGAQITSLYGIFNYNQKWDASYNYWHYARPLFGAVTGSIGALLYLVSLRLGAKGSVTVDPTTFYAVAFIFGFADKSFLQMLNNVTDMILKPAKKASATTTQE